MSFRKAPKYRAKPTVVDGFRFASQAEARRYKELLLLGQAGQVRNLELQPRFDLHVGGVKTATYIAELPVRGTRVDTGCDLVGRYRNGAMSSRT